MSKSTYGVVAFKVPCPDDATDAQIVKQGRDLARKMAQVVKKAGGELTTVGEVYDKAKSSQPRLIEEAVVEVVKNAREDQAKEESK